jgi:hypothetical protein
MVPAKGGGAKPDAGCRPPRRGGQTIFLGICEPLLVPLTPTEKIFVPDGKKSMFNYL